MKDAILYSFCAGIAFTIGVMLLAVRSGKLQDNTAFCRMKRFLAYAAFIEVIIDVLSLGFISHGYELAVMNSFLKPFACCNQLALVTLALLGLIQYRFVTWTSVFKFIVPLDTLLLVYIAGYLVWNSDGDFFSGYHYVSFVKYSNFSTVMSWIIHINIFLELSICIIWLLVQTIRYLKRLESYFSGNEIVSGQRLVYLIYCYMLFFVVAFFDFTIDSLLINSIFIIINLSLFIIFTAILLNLSDSYKKIAVAAEPETEHVPNMANEVTDNYNVGVARILNKWVNQPEKPYLQEGITIASVAASLHLSRRLLSEFLNKFYSQNFNAWINALRVNEAKRLMDESENFSLTQVAEKAGFSDLSCMSRAFKRKTGMSPSQYRTQLHKLS